MSTVSFSRSPRSSSETRCMRTSVYRIAAAPSPSMEPKLPCPSTSGTLSENVCAMRTMQLYTELSPCGWYLPITSPTTRADFMNFVFHVFPSSCMAKRQRLWTGFKPSRTSGSARPTMTLIE